MFFLFFFGLWSFDFWFFFGDLRNMSSTHSKNFCEKNGVNAPYKTKLGKKNTVGWLIFGQILEFVYLKNMISTPKKGFMWKNGPNFTTGSSR